MGNETHTAKAANDDGGTDTEHDAGGPGRPERRPLTYDRNGSERLRPGISKLDADIECPTCSGRLVHLPARDPANPYDSRALIMCAECFRAVLVEVTDDEEPNAETPNPDEEPDALEVGHEQADIFETTGTDEPRGQRPDPTYTRERGGFTPYGWTGPVGVNQKDLFDFEREDEDEPEVRTDGGEQVRRTVRDSTNKPGNENLETTLTKTDTGVRIKTKIQRGTGTNDRDTVTGEVRRESLGEAAEELSNLEMVLRGHLREIRGWDEDGTNRNDPADSDGDEQAGESE